MFFFLETWNHFKHTFHSFSLTSKFNNLFNSFQSIIFFVGDQDNIWEFCQLNSLLSCANSITNLSILISLLWRWLKFLCHGLGMFISFNLSGLCFLDPDMCSSYTFLLILFPYYINVHVKFELIGELLTFSKPSTFVNICHSLL